MRTPKTLSDIQNLLQYQVEESTELEYKSSVKTPNPKWKEEVAKDVSAMANANGGIIIYGVREKAGANGRSIPSEITPIKNDEISKDAISQIISANIQPKIEGIEISTIPYDEESILYVVEIPQSSTAHQNKLTKQYHKRRNSTIEAMEDYEIRDIMNRVKYPEIVLHFEIIKTTIITKKSPNYTDILAGKKTQCEETSTYYQLSIIPYNKGSVFCQYLNYNVYINKDIVDKSDQYPQEENYIRVYGENTIRDVVDYVSNPLGGGYNKYGPSRYDPILPRRYGTSKKIDLTDSPNLNDGQIDWIVYADNAPQRLGKIKLQDIKIVEKSEQRVERSLFGS